MGLSRDGYNLTSSDDYLERIVAELNNEFPNMSNASNNFAIVMARVLSLLLEENDNIRAEGYNNAYVSTAVGQHLDKAVATAGIVRKYGTKSYGRIEVLKNESQPSIMIAPNTLIETNGLQFETINTGFIIIDHNNPVEIEIASKEVGEKYNIPNNSGFVPVVAIRGLKSMISKDGTSGGTEPENDQDLRARYYLAINSFANSSLNGIIAEVSKIQDVVRVSGRENNTDEEVNGLPPHSFEIFVEGSAESIIADKIWNTKPAGIQTYGDISVNVELEGNLYPIRFSRFDKQNVFYKLSVRPKVGISAPELVDQMKEAIMQFTKSVAVINHSELVGYIYNNVEGISILQDIRFGLTENPETDDEIVIETGKIFFTDVNKISISVLGNA